MNYEEFINSIRESRDPHEWFEYSECHHIIPRCMGGSDDWSNLIYLTYREHFIAHKLLFEENPENHKLWSAYWLLSSDGKHATPEEYAEAREEFQIRNVHDEVWRANCSEWMTGRKQCLGKIWIHNDEGTTKMVNPSEFDSYISAGWIEGRGEFQTAEAKDLCSKAASGRIWINNGIQSKMVYELDGIPDGWVRGRIMNNRDSKGRVTKFNE